MNINVDELQFEFKFRDDENFPAQMTLIIGQFKVKGFTVRKTSFEISDKSFVLFPPSSPSGRGKWIKLFWTDDKPDWELLEKKALQSFHNKHTDFVIQGAITKSDKNINPDEIKF